MNARFRSSRREFLKSSASAMTGGFVLGFHLPDAAAQPATETEINAWIVIRPDDTVIIRVARSEMGQGSFTGLPMLVAEELECEWSRVRAEYASPNQQVRRNRVWVTMATGGSRAIRESQEYLRRAGATAREMLIAAAAQRWNAAAADCAAAGGVITHKESGRKLRYGQVAAAAAKLAPPKDVKLKNPQDWTLLGKPIPRFDIPDMVTGKSLYGIDVRLPGMVYAAIAQCPVFGGKLKSADGAAATKLRGVIRVVPLEDAFAVVADSWWRAQQALKAVAVEWDEGAGADASSDSIREFLLTGQTAADIPVARNDGDVEAAFGPGSAQVIEAEYHAPFLGHATLEPQNCTAWIRGDRVDVWAPTQNAEASLAAAAETAGVPRVNVEVHKLPLGGGFGRRGAFQDFVKQAVRIAKAMPGRPVKLLWSREEDMQHDFYRPVSLTRMKAGLDGNGMPVAWRTRIADPSILAQVRPEQVHNGIDRIAVGVFADMPYAVPNLRVEYAMRNTHVPVGFWRAAAHSQNAFFRESFVDEMAHAGGKDPYALRRQLLGRNLKYLGVLDAAARAAEWGSPLPDGVHRGIAVQDAYGSYAAAVIEVKLGAKNELAIRRVVVAVDPGYVVNSPAAIAQVQGCVVFGLTAALWGENTVKNGRIRESNFHDYRLMRLREMPKVEAVLVPSGGFWGGMGEPPLAPLAPALGNAIFAATGRRIRSLPLKNHGFTLVPA